MHERDIIMQPKLIDQVVALSSGTLSRLCNSVLYSEIDAWHSKFLNFCYENQGYNTWQDVYNAFKES